MTAAAARRYEAGLDAARAGLPCPSADPAARRGWEKAGRDAARADALARRMAPVLVVYRRALVAGGGGVTPRRGTQSPRGAIAS